MKKISFFSAFIFLQIILLVNCSAQSLVGIGNTNFPINDNTSSATASAINTGWQINGMGKIIKIVPHPSIATTLYACSASGGIYKTTNSGTTWAPITGSFLPGVQFGTLAIDPGNNNIMYAGTGEPTYAQTYGWTGFGVFKSTDAGATWSIMNTGMGNIVVSDIIINPANTLMLVAATKDGIFKTIDGGLLWTPSVASPSLWIQQILRQGSGNNLIAVGGNRFYRSTDFGSVWTTSDLDPAFSSTFANGRIAIAPSNSNVVYAGWVNNTFGTCNNACIFYSTDGGISFLKKYAFSDAVKLISYDGISSTGYGWANFFITVSQTDPNTIWTGGHLIYKSTNNGVNWSPVLSQWYCCTHTDIHQLMYDPNNSGKFLNANDGGVFVSSDQGFTWAPLSNGLSCNQYMSMGQSNIDPNFVIGGLQDNGIIYNNTDGNYHTYTGGDLYDHMICDYTNSYNVYTSYNGGKVFNPYNRSQVANLNLPANVYTSGTGNSRQDFILSALDPAIAYAWGTNVYRSKNINVYNLSAGTSSVSWTQISTFGVTIRDVKTSPVSDDVVYALGNNTTIYKSINATTGSPTFAATALPGGASTSVSGSVTVSAFNPNVVYVTANNAVYRSTDAGANWTNYTATGLPAINFNKIFADHFSTIEGVYLVTTLGVYYRDLTMAAWAPVNPQVISNLQNSTANYSNVIAGASFYKGSGSATSHVSFATWGSGVWKSTFYNQQMNALTGNWSNADVGTPAIAGSGNYDNIKSTFNLSGAGTGINNTGTDQFNFTKISLSGDGDIMVKIYSVAETDAANGLSKTGLMLRTSLNANSPYVMIALTGHAGAVFQYRANAGDVSTVTTVAPAPSIAYPYFVKINKALNVFTAYISPDGIVWTQAGQVNLNLGAVFLGGVAVTSNTAAASNKSSTGDVTFNTFIALAIDNIQLHAILKDKNKIGLSWSFVSDEPVNNVVLERSEDGIRFTSMLQKNYLNNSGLIKTFNDLSIDETPVSGNNYYRLKIIQQNGNVKYSNVERVNIKSYLIVKTEPNPVRTNGTLKIILAGGVPASQITIDIFDMTGRKIRSAILSATGNEISMSNVPAGTYLYRIVYDNDVVTARFVVQQ